MRKKSAIILKAKDDNPLLYLPLVYNANIGISFATCSHIN